MDTNEDAKKLLKVIFKGFINCTYNEYDNNKILVKCVEYFLLHNVSFMLKCKTLASSSMEEKFKRQKHSGVHVKLKQNIGWLKMKTFEM